MNKIKILCIDDEPHILDALERLFRQKYHVLKSVDPIAALDILKQQDIPVIICDQRMPGMSGTEFYKQALDFHQDGIRILLTGYTDIDSLMDAINSGEIYRYITKPWDPIDLQNTVDKAVEKWSLRKEVQQKNLQLKMAYEELSTLDMAKTQFMYLINHELKTPLTIIVSYLQLLKETALDEEQLLFVKKINEGEHRLSKIIERVLFIMRAETGQIQLNLQPTSLTHWFEGLKELIKKAPHFHERELLWQPPQVDATCNLDESLLNLCVLELLDNAFKFSHKNSPIEIRFRLRQDGFLLDVINQGSEISQKNREKILSPFTLDEEMLHHSTGLGLGLNLCLAYLKLFGATLSVESKNECNKFSISLPLKSNGSV